MKKLILLTLLFVGCSTIEKTTTTETVAQTIPSLVVHDTTYVPIFFDAEITDAVADSIGKIYLEKYCKGTVKVDTAILKATISFQTRKIKGLVGTLNEKDRYIIEVKTDLEKKEQEIERIKTTTKTEEIPSDLWMLWRTITYWLPFSLFTALLGFIACIIVKLKTQLLNKVL